MIKCDIELLWITIEFYDAKPTPAILHDRWGEVRIQIPAFRLLEHHLSATHRPKFPALFLAPSCVFRIIEIVLTAFFHDTFIRVEKSLPQSTILF
jgi:hypothetical protein